MLLTFRPRLNEESKRITGTTGALGPGGLQDGQEVVEMLKCGYLEQTPKAERALGPFLLLIVFMVLFADF